MIKEKINRNKILLFQEIESVNNWDTFFTTIYNEKHHKILPQTIPITKQELKHLQLPKDEPVKPINLESWAYDVKESNTNMKQQQQQKTHEQQEHENNMNLEISDNETINQILDEVMQENLNFDTFIENT
jgi:hypothetical protein